MGGKTRFTTALNVLLLPIAAQRKERKRGQVQFAGTALRMLRTNWTCPLFRSSTIKIFVLLTGSVLRN